MAVGLYDFDFLVLQAFISNLNVHEYNEIVWFETF